MIKNLLFLFVLVSILFGVELQAQTKIENPGFEDWEPDDTSNPKFEPVNWSSLKTSDNSFAAGAAPIVMRRADDAHTGNYSVYLINIYNSIIDYVAPGSITNGRVHVDPQFDLEKSTMFTDTSNSQWNTPLTSRPDSIVGWYKTNPASTDFPTVKVVLHSDSSSIPNADSATWIAMAYWEGEPGEVVDNWRRFAIPFNYFNNDVPEYFLTILTSGNGLSASGGSEAWFDDLELIYSGTDIFEETANQLYAYYTGDELVVNISDHNLKDTELNVIDLNGRRVYSDRFNTAHENRYRLNLPDGVYIVQITSGRTQLSKKIIIQ